MYVGLSQSFPVCMKKRTNPKLPTPHIQHSSQAGPWKAGSMQHWSQAHRDLS